MADLNELKQKLAGTTVQGAPDEKVPKSHSKEVGKVDRRKQNKRHPNSGRKPKEETLVIRGIKAKIDEYTQGLEEIEVKDPKTGQTRKVAKPRIIWAIETFFKFGMELANKGDSTGIHALEKFLDRSLGKAAQPIRGEGEDDAPIKIGVDIGGILRKAYGNQED